MVQFKSFVELTKKDFFYRLLYFFFDLIKHEGGTIAHKRFKVDVNFF